MLQTTRFHSKVFIDTIKNRTFSIRVLCLPPPEIPPWKRTQEMGILVLVPTAALNRNHHDYKNNLISRAGG